MPSSTSSSDGLRDARAGTPDRYARQTAADRPGVAQPVPVRPVPAQPWGRILLGTVLLLVLLVAGWEEYWRAYGARPGIANTFGLCRYSAGVLMPARELRRCSWATRACISIFTCRCVSASMAGVRASLQS